MKQLLIILLSLIALATHAQVFIGNDGAVHPVGVFPVASTNDVKGAPKQKATIAERNAIPLSLRDTGMTCYVSNIGNGSDGMFILKGGIQDANWVPFSTGGGGNTIIAKGGNAITDTITADGSKQDIAIYIGNPDSIFVSGVQNTTVDGGGAYTFKQVGDSLIIHYSQAPEGSIVYKISLFGPFAGGGGSGGSGGGGSGGDSIIIIIPPPFDTSGNSAWTYVLDTSCQIKYGANFAQGATSNMVALANTGLSYARVPYNNSGSPSYSSYTTGGYNVLLSYNPAPPVQGSYFPLPTDTLAYRNSLNAFLNSNGTTNITGIAFINEPGNIKHGTGYWNPGSASNVIKLLRTGANVAHEHGLQATEGGFSGEIFFYEVWKDYINRDFPDSAAAFAAAMFPTGTNLNNWANDTTHGYRIRYLDTIIAALPKLPLDYTNLHIGLTTLDNDSADASIDVLPFKQMVRYLHRVSGKPVISNEITFQNNNNPDILSQIIDAIEDLHDAKNGDMSMVYFLNHSDHPFVNSDGSLTDFGIALKNKIQETKIDVTGTIQ